MYIHLNLPAEVYIHLNTSAEVYVHLKLPDRDNIKGLQQKGDSWTWLAELPVHPKTLNPKP